MPTHLKALLFILAIATVTFMLAKALSRGVESSQQDFDRRRNLWFALTLIAFLSHNFWIYTIVAAVLVLLSLPRESNKLALYLFLLLAVPPFGEEISGLGIIQHLFSINYHRLLALTILVPAFLYLRKQPDVVPFGKLLPDKLIASYILLLFGLTLTVATFTNTLRSSLFYAFLDIFLPYYVASRSIRTFQDFRDALLAFVSGAMVMGAIGVFEAGRHWLLYSALARVMGNDLFFDYLLRDGEGLRAQGSTGQAIVLGYVLMVALGFYLYLSKLILKPIVRHLVLLVLIAGLLAPLSRGPWVGAVAILLVFVATGPSPLKLLMQAVPYMVAVFAALLAVSSTDKILALVPFFGTEAESAGTIDYRQRLLQVGIEHILENPVFGSFDFYLSASAQDLKQGSGMIDLVNTYLGVGLNSGLVGLSLYCGFFAAVAFGIFREMRNQSDKTGEPHRLGQALLSTLIGMLIVLVTVSSIYAIPLLTWCAAGLGVAYVHMLAEGRPALSRQTVHA